MSYQVTVQTDNSITREGIADWAILIQAYGRETTVCNFGKPNAHAAYTSLMKHDVGMEFTKAFTDQLKALSKYVGRDPYWLENQWLKMTLDEMPPDTLLRLLDKAVREDD